MKRIETINTAPLYILKYTENIDFVAFPFEEYYLSKSDALERAKDLTKEPKNKITIQEIAQRYVNTGDYSFKNLYDNGEDFK